MRYFAVTLGSAFGDSLEKNNIYFFNSCTRPERLSMEGKYLQRNDVGGAVVLCNPHVSNDM